MGSLYQRNQVWYIDYRVGGKRIRKRIGSSKKLAELALKDMEVKIARNEIGFIERKKKVSDFIEEFTRFLEVNKKPKTTQRYLEVISHFKSFLAEYPNFTFVSQIQNLIIEEYKQIRSKAVMPKTVNLELGVLNYFFNLAIKYNYLQNNPVSDVEKLKLKKKQPRFFSKEEVKMILENCGKRLYPIFLAFLYTGMRRDELRNLEWSDVDFKNKLIDVKVKDFWEPKNGSSRRIPIKENLYRVLKSLDRKSNWVFSTGIGNQARHLRRDLIKVCNNLGIQNVTLHTFRHTFASHLIMSGVDLPTVQKLLGHKDIKTTMIYAHLAPEHINSAIEKLKF